MLLNVINIAKEKEKIALLRNVPDKKLLDVVANTSNELCKQCKFLTKTRFMDIY